MVFKLAKSAECHWRRLDGTNRLGQLIGGCRCRCGTDGVDNLHSRFESFMKPFCGPATKNLPGYAAWFITKLTGDETAAHGAAWQRLLAA